MPPSPSASPSPSNNGLYLVPYWVRGGRLWGVIALVLVLGGLVLPVVLSSVRRQASSRGFGRGVATSLCSLAHPSTDLSHADALAHWRRFSPVLCAPGLLIPRLFSSA